MSGGGRDDNMRNGIVAICSLLCSILSTPVYADDSPPLLLKPPLPPGLTFPRATYLPTSPLPSELLTSPGDHVVCLVLVVGTDGHVSDIRLLKSSGVPAIDSAAAGLAERTRYEPATLNGVPIAVRMLSARHLTATRPANPEGLEKVCSWDLLKVTPPETNSPKPSTGQNAHQ